MPYIARTGGTPELLEIREGTLTDIPEAERSQWLTVQESSAGLDPITQVRAGFLFSVNQMGDQVQLIHQSVTMPTAWRRMRLKQSARDKRWRVEVGGTMLGGMAIPTDDRAKVLIKGAAETVGDEDIDTFILGDVAIAMTGLQFKAAWAAVVEHVRLTFSTLAAVYDAIDADTILTTADIDAADWPSNT